MFWGLIMEPNKRYTQVVEKPFHISQAAMDTSTGDGDPCQVMVVVDGKNFLICTLQKNKTIQVPLDMYFKMGDAVSFLTNGKCNIHLTGYLDPEFEDLSEEEESAEEEPETAPVPTKNKRKLENGKEIANKKAKIQDKKGKKEKVAEDSSEEEDADDLRKILDAEDIDTDDNDDSFKLNTTAEGSDSDDEEDEDDDEEEDDEGDEEADEEEGEKEDESEEADTTLDTSQDEKVDMSKLSKSQKRRLKKKMQKVKKEQGQVNGVEKPKKEKLVNQQEKKAGKTKADVKESPEAQAVDKKEKKTLSGGVVIEDTKVGSGPVAKPGKVVMVYYEGKLKQNNKMFDNCLKGPGFKFRLGGKEVISGWDVGVAGMKVGGKRKIICPPAMAYGAKGSPPAIPPNSTLVFEVELKNVK